MNTQKMTLAELWRIANEVLGDYFAATENEINDLFKVRNVDSVELSMKYNGKQMNHTYNINFGYSSAHQSLSHDHFLELSKLFDVKIAKKLENSSKLVIGEIAANNYLINFKKYGFENFGKKLENE